MSPERYTNKHKHTHTPKTRECIKSVTKRPKKRNENKYENVGRPVYWE